MSAAPRAERLRDHFVGWQCRIRADAMRRREGRPTLGMRPQALSAAGEELAPAVTTLLVRKEAEAFAPEFRHLARRTHDPRAMREAALALLAERYYQYARDFSGLLTATFAAESPLAATLAHEGRCVLSFAQDGQRYALPCAVALLGVCAAEVLAADRQSVAVAELAYRVWLGAWAVAWPGGGRGQSEPSKADRPHAACHHTSSPCRARGNSAPDCPHHAAIAARRLMFSARHTRCHSPRTLSKPRRLNRRNPSTSLTQPFGPSDIHLRLAY